jgi:hypothetical protein
VNIITHIEKANLSAILTHNSAMLLYNNARTVIVNSGGVEVWARGTNDQWSDDLGFVEQKAFSNFPLVTPNGLYVLYQPLNQNTIRVAFNVFNSAAFADSCAIGSKERISRAVQRQLDFCSSQLQSSDPDVSIENLFADKRCTCLAKNIIFEKLFPNAADRDSFGASQARLKDNLPCLLSSCQDALGNKEVTNVYNVIYGQCQNADLSLCSAVLTKGVNTQINLVSGVVSQACGTSLVGCTQDSNCPHGQTCSNGRCVSPCLVNGDCLPGYLCTSAGVCVKPLPDPPIPQNQNTQTSKTLMIVLIVMVIIILISLFLVLFVKKK